MRAGFPSQTDHDVAAAAARRARLPISARQVKRWRGRGLIGSPKREWPGYAQGSRSSADDYPAGTVERVATIAKWTTQGVSLNDIAVLLFVGDEAYPMALATIRTACSALADDVLKAGLWRDTPHSAGPTERAEFAAARVMRVGRESK